MPSPLLTFNKKIDQYRNKVTFLIAIILFSLSVIGVLISIYFKSNTIRPTILSSMVGLILIFLIVLKKYDWAYFTVVFGSFFVILYGTYVTKSGSALSMVGVLLIFSSIFGSIEYTIFIFVVTIIFIGLMVITNNFTINQTLISPYNIALVNNIQSTAIIIPMSFLISLYINYVLRKTIAFQNEQ